MTQYVQVEFTPGGRPYTYKNDGDPVAMGDRVKVQTAKEGEKTVSVVGIVAEKPKFECRPVLGLAPEKDKEKAVP